MTAEKLQEILRKHALWLNGDPDGEKADLRRTDLRGVNLHGANLRNADLNSANLYRADLSSAILDRADLSGANLSGANLSSANLSGVNLYEVSLRKADMRDANLYRADLRKADLLSQGVPAWFRLHRFFRGVPGRQHRCTGHAPFHPLLLSEDHGRFCQVILLLSGSLDDLPTFLLL